MSRKKKSRSAGFSDVVVVRQRTESDQLAREQKKQKKRKGLKPGSRHSKEEVTSTLVGHASRDPRLGSKKKIPLIVEEVKKPSKQQRKVNAEQELEMLENDVQLNVLLERIEQGEKLGAGLQNYVDEKLDRIEILMKQLGLYEEEPEDGAEQQSASQNHKKSTSTLTEDDLLSRFEQTDIDKLDS